LSSGSTTVFHYAANVTPPRIMLNGQSLSAGWWALVDRYGINEVSTWFFEVWNEPNLQAFWTGSQADYLSSINSPRVRLSSK